MISEVLTWVNFKIKILHERTVTPLLPEDEDSKFL
jgi:hypothetical protein